MTNRHAVALRAFNIANPVPGEEPTPIADGAVLRSMDAGQFGDFEHAGLVRVATDAEVAADRDGKKPTRTKAPTKPKAAKVARSKKVEAPAPVPPADLAPAPAEAPAADDQHTDPSASTDA